MPPIPDVPRDEPAEDGTAGQDETNLPLQELPPVLPEEDLQNIRAYVEMKRDEAEEPVSAILAELDREEEIDAHVVSAHTILRDGTIAGKFPEKGDLEFFLHTLIQARATRYLNDQIRRGTDLDKFGRLIKEWRQQGILPGDTSDKKPVLTPEQIAALAAEALTQARAELDEKLQEPVNAWNMDKQPEPPR